MKCSVLSFLILPGSVGAY